MAFISEVVIHPAFFIYPPLLFIISSAIAFVLSTLRPKAFPPGPRGLPGFGNLFQVDRSFPFLTYGAWSRIYGKDTPLGVKSGDLNVVVLNSGRLIRELVERRGAVYNDRPFQFMNDAWVFINGLKPAIFRNSSSWLSRWRKEFNNTFGSAAITKFRPVFEAETARLLVKLVDSPNATRVELEEILVPWIMSVPTLGTCGRRPDYMGDLNFNIKTFRRVSDEYVALLKPNAMELFPILRHLPEFFGMAAWKEKARGVTDGARHAGNQFLDAAKQQRAALDAGKPIAWESMVAKMLREQHEKQDNMFTATDMGNTAFHIVSAATNTSLATFMNMLMILAKYPEVQKRLRDEILEVSDGAVPKSTDLPSMKYLEAFWNETHRWRPSTPQAVPHAPSQDDVYEGHRIPKGTSVIMNVWHIHHSEEDYEEPDKFNPDRFMDHPFGMRLDDAHDPSRMEMTSTRIIYDFGAGRRVCPGQNTARQTLRLGLAKVLWAFDIVPAVEGKEIDLELRTGYVQEVALRVKSLEVMLKLRGGRDRSEILEHYEKAYEAEAEIMGWTDGLYK